MIREKLVQKEIGARADFRWRSHDISRIEGLSDAVFAFSFALLFIIWFKQYKFFRRYGLQDNLTVSLNGALLFVVLFYVYPLKFLFSYLINVLTGGHGEVRLPNG